MKLKGWFLQSLGMKRWGWMALLWLVVGCAAVWGEPTRGAGARMPTPTPPRPMQDGQRPPPTPVPPTQARPTPAPALWLRTNPGGGGAFNAALTTPHDLWLVASDLSGLYLSHDQGQHWEAVGAAQGLTETHVDALAGQPAAPYALFAGTENGIFRSSDDGRTWQPVLTHGYVSALAFAPTAPQQGYAAVHSTYDQADAQIYATTDGGLTWAPVSGSTLPPGLRVIKLAVAANDPNRLYVLSGEDRFACGPAALFTSPDGGQTWQQLAASVGQVMDFALDPVRPDHLYFSTYGDVWDPGYACVHDDPAGGWVYHGPALTDGPWQQLGPAVGSRNWLLWPHPQQADVLRALDTDARELWLWDGSTWTWQSDANDWNPGWAEPFLAFSVPFSGDAKAWAPHPTDPNVLLWVDSQFVWTTHDGGQTFFPAHTQEVVPGQWRSTGVDNIVPFDLAVSPDGQWLLAALADLGCWRSRNAGFGWEMCNDPASTGGWNGYGGNSMTVLLDPARPGVVWMPQAPDLEGPYTLLRSDAYGDAWRPSSQGLPTDSLSGLSLDPSSPVAQRTLFVTAGGDVYRSTDDGQSWSLALACGGCRVTAVSPDGRVVLAGGEAGLWRADAHALRAGWEQVFPPVPPDYPGAAFWDAGWNGVAAIRFDPRVPGRVWAAVHGPGQGVWRSDDLGRTWQPVLTRDDVWDVLPTGDAVWVATSSARAAGGYDPTSAGVLRGDAKGRSWQPFNPGLAWPFAVRLAVDDQGTLWAALPGLGYAWLGGAGP